MHSGLTDCGARQCAPISRGHRCGRARVAPGARPPIVVRPSGVSAAYLRRPRSAPAPAPPRIPSGGPVICTVQPARPRCHRRIRPRPPRVVSICAGPGHCRRVCRSPRGRPRCRAGRRRTGTNWGWTGSEAARPRCRRRNRGRRSGIRRRPHAAPPSHPRDGRQCASMDYWPRMLGEGVGWGPPGKFGEVQLRFGLPAT